MPVRGIVRAVAEKAQLAALNSNDPAALVVALAHTLLRQSGLRRNADRSSASLRHHRLTLHRVLDPYAVLDKALGKKEHSFVGKVWMPARQIRLSAAADCASAHVAVNFHELEQVAFFAHKWSPKLFLNEKSQPSKSFTSFGRCSGCRWETCGLQKPPATSPGLSCPETRRLFVRMGICCAGFNYTEVKRVYLCRAEGMEAEVTRCPLFCRPPPSKGAGGTLSGATLPQSVENALVVGSPRHARTRRLAVLTQVLLPKCLERGAKTVRKAKAKNITESVRVARVC